MNFGDRFWHLLPVVGRAVVLGVTAAAAGTMPWAALVSANTRHQSALPWAVPLMALYLWWYWCYLVRGTGWPQSTASARRMYARANALSHEAWGLALVAGMLGLVGVLLFQGNVTALLIVVVLTVWAYSMLERATRDARGSRGA